MNKLLPLLLLLFWTHQLQAQDVGKKPSKIRRWLPDDLNAQFAGTIGFVSAGPGYSFAKDHLRLALLYGYVPASEGGDYINTANLKLSADLFTLRLSPRLKLVPYATLLGSMETSGNAILRLPDRYPRDYYRLTGLHLLGALGNSLQIATRPGKPAYLSLYAEVGTVDSYVYYYLRNDVERFTELFTCALGVVYHFK